MPAVLPTLVSPLAVVAAVTVWVAWASTAPLAVRAVALAPSEALVRMLAMVIAIAGVMLTVPPASRTRSLMLIRPRPLPPSRTLPMSNPRPSSEMVSSPRLALRRNETSACWAAACLTTLRNAS